MSDRLDRFVREALAKRIAREEIRGKLLQARWPEDEVAAALDAYADVDFPLPVPRPEQYVSARDAFGYLVLFTTLYASAIALGNLVYQFINRAFPDAAEGFQAAQRILGTVRWSTASLMIAFPVFIWLSRRTYRAIRRDPEKRTSKIRKWLTYITLFVAASVLLCDVITLVFYLLGGELTARFLLKVLTVASIAGSIFGYYLWDLRQDDAQPQPAAAVHRWLGPFVAAVAALVAASIVGGVVIAGSPGAARSQRLDTLRVQHLVWIANSVDSYWRRESDLPSDLESLAQERTGGPPVVRDPVSDAIYEYRPGESGAYELCAVFESEDSQPEIYGTRGERFWGHGAGRHCFAVQAQ